MLFILMGTTKTQSEVDWTSVKIKSCKIEKAIGYKISDNGKTPLRIAIGFEREFK